MLNEYGSTPASQQDEHLAKTQHETTERTVYVLAKLFPTDSFALMFLACRWNTTYSVTHQTFRDYSLDSATIYCHQPQTVSSDRNSSKYKTSTSPVVAVAVQSRAPC